MTTAQGPELPSRPTLAQQAADLATRIFRRNQANDDDLDGHMAQIRGNGPRHAAPGRVDDIRQRIRAANSVDQVRDALDHAAPPADLRDQPAGHAGIGPYRPADLRVYRAYVEELREQLDTAAPRGNQYGIAAAATTLRVAQQAVDIATELAAPYEPLAPGPIAMFSTTEFGNLVSDCGRVTRAMTALTRVLNQQLSVAHLHAQTGRVHAPPGGDPLAEVEAVIREVLAVTEHLIAATDRLAAAGSRVTRLTVPPSADRPSP